METRYICPVCGERFVRKSDHHVFCCDRCRKRWNRADMFGQVEMLRKAHGINGTDNPDPLKGTTQE